MALGENEVRLTVELRRRALVDVRGCGVGARGWSRVNAGLVGKNACERGNLRDAASNLGHSLGCLAVLRQMSGRWGRWSRCAGTKTEGTFINYRVYVRASSARRTGRAVGMRFRDDNVWEKRFQGRDRRGLD
jgi:hypothetical protein